MDDARPSGNTNEGAELPPHRRETLGRDDLLTAWLNARRYQNAHEDLCLFHSRRLEALQAAFSVDLSSHPRRPTEETVPAWLADEVPGMSWGGPLGGDSRSVRLLFDRATAGFLAISSPFSIYVEGPVAVVALFQRHRDSFGLAEHETQEAHRRLLLDLMEIGWGLDERVTVDRGAAIAHGFDPDDKGPDWEDYG